jgi:hypothetical protein
MAIQVTGEITINDKRIQNPLLELVPHLEYRGKINLDVHVSQFGLPFFIEGMSNQWQRVSAIGYSNINKSLLPTPDITSDPYSELLNSLTKFVIDDLSQKFQSCSFEII